MLMLVKAYGKSFQQSARKRGTMGMERLESGIYHTTPHTER